MRQYGSRAGGVGYRNEQKYIGLQLPSRASYIMHSSKALNDLFDHYLHAASNPQQLQCASLLAKDISAVSQHPLFVDQTLDILVHCDPLEPDKLTLLMAMLKDKFQYCYQSLDQDKTDFYCSQLLLAANRWGTSNKAFFSNLCKSLAIIYINSQEKAATLCGFLSNFSLLPTVEARQYYLKILTFCADDVTNDNLVMAKEDRQKARSKMVASQTVALESISQAGDIVWGMEGFDRQHLIECFSAWINIKENPQVLNTLDQLSLFRNILGLLTDRNDSDLAACFLIEVIEGVKKVDQCQTFYLLLFQLLTQEVIPIIPGLPRECLTMALDLVSLVLGFCSKFARTIVAGYSAVVKELLVLPALTYVEIGDKEGKVQDQVIEFGRQLFKEVLSAMRKGREVDTDLRTDTPVRWLMALRSTIRYSPTLIQRYQTLSEKRFFQEQQPTVILSHRDALQEVLQSICKIVTPGNYLNVFLSQMNQTLALLTLPLQSAPCSQLQAQLFMMLPAISNLQEMEPRVSYLVDLYEKIVVGYNHMDSMPHLLHKTFLSMVKSILTIPKKDEQIVVKLMAQTSMVMSASLLAKEARQVFEVGCTHNAVLLSPRVQQILAFVLSQPPSTCLTLGLLQVATVNPRSAAFYIDQLITKLHENCRTSGPSSHKCRDSISCLCEIMRQLRKHDFEDLIPMVKKYLYTSMPFLKSVIRNPVTDEREEDENTEVEKVVKLLKYVMRLLKGEFFEFVEELFNAVNDSFKRYPICSLVYLVEVAVTVFRPLENGLQVIIPIYQHFTANALEHYRKNHVERLSYLTEDLLGMNHRIILYYADIITTSATFPQLFEFVIRECLPSKEKTVLMAVDRFFFVIFKIFWTPGTTTCEDFEEDDIIPVLQNQVAKQNLKMEIMKNAESIVWLLLQQIDLAEQKKHEEILIETLLAELRAFPEENPGLWMPRLHNIPGDILLVSQKEQMLKLLLEIQSKHRQGLGFEETVEKKMEEYLKLVSKRFGQSGSRRERIERHLEQ